MYELHDTTKRMNMTDRFVGCHLCKRQGGDDQLLLMIELMFQALRNNADRKSVKLNTSESYIHGAHPPRAVSTTPLPVTAAWDLMTASPWSPTLFRHSHRRVSMASTVVHAMTPCLHLSGHGHCRTHDCYPGSPKVEWNLHLAHQLSALQNFTVQDWLQLNTLHCTQPDKNSLY